jgi:hypothetical protein
MKNLTITTALSLAALSLSLASPASADTLVLRDGRSMNGTIVSVEARMVTFQDGAGVFYEFSANQVTSVAFTYGNATVANPNSVRLQTLPLGMELAVTTSEPIDSATAKVGQTFSAVVEHTFVDDSNVIIVPAGARIVLIVRQVSSGNASKIPALSWAIQSVTVGVHRYLVQTTNLKPSDDGNVVMLDKGNELRVPKDTVLKFKLSKALNFEAEKQ